MTQQIRWPCRSRWAVVSSIGSAGAKVVSENVFGANKHEKISDLFQVRNGGVIRLQSDVISSDCAKCKPLSAFDKWQKGDKV